jgi:hypothetical protein
MSSIKKLNFKGTLRQVFICLIPIPPVTNLIRTYTYSQREGGRGEREPERRLEGQQITKLGQKY